MTTSESEINSTAASLLGFLHDGPQTGWDLVRTAQGTIGPFWSLTRSQVYRELAAMAEKGLVAAGPTGPRDRRPYSITPAGRAAFVRWAEAGPGEASMRLPLLLFVTLGRHLPPGRLARTVREQRAHQARLLADYVALRDRLDTAPGSADPHTRAVLDYGIAVARATVRWLDHLPPELLDAAPDDTPPRPLPEL